MEEGGECKGGGGGRVGWMEGGGGGEMSGEMVGWRMVGSL